MVSRSNKQQKRGQSKKIRIPQRQNLEEKVAKEIVSSFKNINSIDKRDTIFHMCYLSLCACIKDHSLGLSSIIKVQL